MKKIIIILSMTCFAFSLNAQLTVNSTGNVTLTKAVTFGTGINLANSDFLLKPTTQPYPIIFMSYSTGYLGIAKGPNQPSYVMDIGGTIRVVTTLYTSDSRVKKDIIDLPQSKVNGLYSLKSKSYKFDDSKLSQFGITSDESTKREHFGFLAQDIQKVYPELVYEDSLGSLSIDYIGMIPILLESIKSLKLEVDALKSQINIDSKNKSAGISTNLSGATLSQNVPNPFNENTTIGFFLPTTVQSALLCVYDMQGKQIKSINVTDREAGNVVIHASELQPGMYYYSLIADGNIIGTEKMILTE
jgi:hypothetical protein